MSGKKRRRGKNKKDSKRNLRRRVRAKEKCSCLCHNPKTRYLVFHCAPCCGGCHYCGVRRIKNFYLEAHRERCRKIVTDGQEKGGA